MARGRQTKSTELVFASGRVLVGDCLTRLADLPDASVDAVVTDPPYEIGFMGKGWDSTGIAYNVELWRQCLRVLKPGGHLLAFGATRSYHRMAVAIEDAGFEIRDSIHWMYGSGFPKSLDVSKAIDKAAGAEREVLGKSDELLGRKSGIANGTKGHTTVGGTRGEAYDITAPATDAAKQWAGWGTALKPAHEPIVVARKPLAGTVAANVLEHGTGALNIDGCRVEGVPRTTHAHGNVTGSQAKSLLESGLAEGYQSAAPAGRWPANIVFTHAADCEVVGERKVKGGPTAEVMKRAAERRLANGTPGSNIGMDSWVLAGARTAAAGMAPSYSSPDGTETIPAYQCAPGCPVAELDRQSGRLKGFKGAKTKGFSDSSPRVFGTGLGVYEPGEWVNGYGDDGGASRFFTVTEWSELDAPFRYVAKPSKAERNAGLGGLGAKQVDSSRDADAAGANNPRNRGGASATNFHPTVKPVALMRWLVRLVTPEGGTVLDPFLGSGTTAAAAILEGRSWIGCEMTADYLPIIEGRVTWAAGEHAAGRADQPRYKTPPATDTAEAAARPAKDDTSPPQQAGLFDVA